MKICVLLISTILISLFSNSVQADSVEIEIHKFSFTPPVVTISRGDSVVWVNREKRQYHNVWFQRQEGIEPDYLFPGDRYEKVFGSAGEYAYRCGPHPEMTATVIVE